MRIVLQDAATLGFVALVGAQFFPYEIGVVVGQLVVWTLPEELKHFTRAVLLADLQNVSSIAK